MLKFLSSTSLPTCFLCAPGATLQMMFPAVCVCVHKYSQGFDVIEKQDTKETIIDLAHVAW